MSLDPAIQAIRRLDSPREKLNLGSPNIRRWSTQAARASWFSLTNSKLMYSTGLERPRRTWSSKPSTSIFTKRGTQNCRIISSSVVIGTSMVFSQVADPKRPVRLAFSIHCFDMVENVDEDEIII